MKRTAEEIARVSISSILEEVCGMILDVGCGTKPMGDVNVDLMAEGEEWKRVKLEPKTIPNFVKADANHLPFKDSLFKTVISFHLLEHVDNPFQVMQEMLRVSNGKVITILPYKWFEEIADLILFRRHKREWRRQHHRREYTKSLLTKSLESMGLKNFRLKYRFVSLNHAIFHMKAVYDYTIPIPIPFEIMVVIEK